MMRVFRGLMLSRIGMSDCKYIYIYIYLCRTVIDHESIDILQTPNSSNPIF